MRRLWTASMAESAVTSPMVDGGVVTGEYEDETRRVKTLLQAAAETVEVGLKRRDLSGKLEVEGAWANKFWRRMVLLVKEDIFVFITRLEIKIDKNEFPTNYLFRSVLFSSKLGGSASESPPAILESLLFLQDWFLHVGLSRLHAYAHAHVYICIRNMFSHEWKLLLLVKWSKNQAPPTRGRINCVLKWAARPTGKILFQFWLYYYKNNKIYSD